MDSKSGVTKFDEDFGWQRRFMPEIKRILGEYLIGESPAEEDMQRNTDLIVLKLDAVRIGCRIRRHTYLSKYANEFTIRSDRPSGMKTEMRKLVSGWGDYLFYGFSNEAENSLSAWMLGSLHEFREYVADFQCKHGGKMPGISKNNPDGSSSFRAFKIEDLPPSFVVGRKEADLVAAVDTDFPF